MEIKKTKMSDYIKKAWMIQCEPDKPNSYAGIGWWNFYKCLGTLPAVFGKRAEARKYLKDIKKPLLGYRKAKVVRVEICIKNLTSYNAKGSGGISRPL